MTRRALQYDWQALPEPSTAVVGPSPAFAVSATALLVLRGSSGGQLRE
jgi:hypothetical protein